MSRDVLLVDSNVEEIIAMISDALHGVAQVRSCSEFSEARRRLLTSPPDVLVTNLRLQSYNGLHLALLAAMTSTRCLVYSDSDDLILAREVQRLGAFYERSSRLPFVLPAFIKSRLPERDRRDVQVLDRRLVSRGGRRTTDYSR
jgi:DNA-binding NarL/FixJ family response regulator